MSGTPGLSQAAALLAIEMTSTGDPVPAIRDRAAELAEMDGRWDHLFDATFARLDRMRDAHS